MFYIYYVNKVELSVFYHFIKLMNSKCIIFKSLIENASCADECKHVCDLFVIIVKNIGW